MPVRVQLSRAKGWRMPENTVKVDRTTVWGNPFTATGKMRPGAKIGRTYIAVPTVEDAVECFREFMVAEGSLAEAFRGGLPALRGKNLACWCKLPAPGEPDICHAAVLLELANAPLEQTAEPAPVIGDECKQAAQGEARSEVNPAPILPKGEG